MPRTRDKVKVSCGNCGTIRIADFRDVLKTMSSISPYTEVYKCHKCIKNNPECRSQRKPIEFKKSKEERSLASKRLWSSQEYRAKMDAGRPTWIPEQRKALSDKIKDKFKNDDAYRQKVTEARRKVWQDKSYRDTRSSNLSEFVRKAHSIHGHTYDYSRSVYINSDTKLFIICHKHGPFEQRPSHHLHFKNGCPQCAFSIITSRQQQMLADYIKNDLGVKVDLNYVMACGLHLDIVSLERRIAVEYHGGYWHSNGPEELTNPYLRNRHLIKLKKATEEGFRLYQFFDHEVSRSLDVVKSMIAHAFGFSKKLQARKLKFAAIDQQAAKAFFIANHIGGSQPADLYFGLYDNYVLVSALSLKRRKEDFELIRYATLLGKVVVGGLSKMIKNSGPAIGYLPIFSYANCRYSSANGGYASVGFQYAGHTKPGYRWWFNNHYHDRRSFQKHKLKEKLKSFAESKTEAENMFAAGYRRIWDAGHFKYVYNSWDM